MFLKPELNIALKNRFPTKLTEEQIEENIEAKK